MTSKTPPGACRSDAILQTARAHYAEISAALRAATANLDAADDKGLRAFVGAAQSHWKALQSVLDKERELEKSDHERAGIVNAYAVDLAAARSEVGRRLACLKATGGD